MLARNFILMMLEITLLTEICFLSQAEICCDYVRTFLADYFFEFLFMRVGVGELDDVVGQGLHLSVDPEAMAIDFWILLRVFEIQRVETFGNRIVLRESLL